MPTRTRFIGASLSVLLLGGCHAGDGGADTVAGQKVSESSSGPIHPEAAIRSQTILGLRLGMPFSEALERLRQRGIVQEVDPAKDPWSGDGPKLAWSRRAWASNVSLTEIGARDLARLASQSGAPNYIELYATRQGGALLLTGISLSFSGEVAAVPDLGTPSAKVFERSEPRRWMLIWGSERYLGRPGAVDALDKCNPHAPLPTHVEQWPPPACDLMPPKKPYLTVATTKADKSRSVTIRLRDPSVNPHVELF